LAKEKHPDRNLGSDSSEDFIQLQQSFDTLGSPTLRIRYELYGRTEEDAMVKDLANHAGFYLQGLLLAYSLTCNKVVARAEYGEGGDVCAGVAGAIWQCGVVD
jgi:DnaJ-class molecular chaperone